MPWIPTWITNLGGLGAAGGWKVLLRFAYLLVLIPIALKSLWFLLRWLFKILFFFLGWMLPVRITKGEIHARQFGPDYVILVPALCIIGDRYGVWPSLYSVIEWPLGQVGFEVDVSEWGQSISKGIEFVLAQDVGPVVELIGTGFQQSWVFLCDPWTYVGLAVICFVVRLVNLKEFNDLLHIAFYVLVALILLIPYSLGNYDVFLDPVGEVYQEDSRLVVAGGLFVWWVLLNVNAFFLSDLLIYDPSAETLDRRRRLKKTRLHRSDIAVKTEVRNWIRCALLCGGVDLYGVDRETGKAEEFSELDIRYIFGLGIVLAIWHAMYKGQEVEAPEAGAKRRTRGVALPPKRTGPPSRRRWVPRRWQKKDRDSSPAAPAPAPSADTPLPEPAESAIPVNGDSGTPDSSNGAASDSNSGTATKA